MTPTEKFYLIIFVVAFVIAVILAKQGLYNKNE